MNPDTSDILELITKEICQKNHTSFLLFDKYFKLLSYNDNVIEILDEPQNLLYGEDIREMMWNFIGLEDEILSLLEEPQKTITIPMVLKHDNYYDMEVETINTQEDGTLLIAYFIRKSKQSLEYIEMIKKINKKTLILQTQQTQEDAFLLQKHLLSFHVDLEGMITEVSEPFNYFFNIETSKVKGVHFSNFFQTPKQELHSDENTIVSAKDLKGNTVYFNVTVIPIYKNKKLYENLLVCQDVSYLKQAQRKLEYVYDIDALTGLPNRNHMLNTIDNYLQTAPQCEVALITIKNFKEINLEYGFHAGDMLLKHITQLLIELVGMENTIARVGGDEFGILFDTLDLHTLPSLSSIIHTLQSTPLPYTQDESITFTLLGVEISCDNNTVDADTLMKKLSRKMDLKKHTTR